MDTLEMTSAGFWRSSVCRVMVNPRDPAACAQAAQMLPHVRGMAELSGHLLFATSGSSAGSKWVALSREALLASAEVVNRHLGATKNDRWLLALPEFHVGGAGILARSCLAGNEVVRCGGKWNPQAFCRLAEAERVSLASLVPTQLVDLVNGGHQSPAGLRAVLVGGGRLDTTVYRRAVGLGWPVVETYGMTETCSQIATAAHGSRELGILPGWQTKLAESGRLMVKGKPLLTGYVSCGGSGCRLTDPKVDGWYVAGDLVELHGSCLKVIGRADRCVKVLGELVNLAHVEMELAELAGLSGGQAGAAGALAVVAVPESRRGHRLVLCAERGFCLNGLLEGYNAGCNPVARVESVVVLDDMPRSPLGKVRYAALLDLLGGE